MTNYPVRILTEKQKQLFDDCKRIANENHSDLSKEIRKFLERYRKKHLNKK